VRAVLVGLGAVGTRVARHLVADPDLESLLVIHRDQARAERRTEGLGPKVTLRQGRPTAIPAGTDVVIVATEDAPAVAAAAVRSGAHTVAAIDDPHQVRALLELDGPARAAGLTVAIGTVMAPGLSCVLARFGAGRLDRVEEIHVASYGTGGPACARRHHSALRSVSTDWYDGSWWRRPGGSGRELVWFPEPVGGADCYRARLIDPVLLVPAFPGVARVTSRLAATRRDRLTSPLPMLRRPHPEGVLGAARVELRGWRGGEADSVVVGGLGRPALVAGTVAAVAARWAMTGRLARPGAAGLAELVDDAGGFLRELRVRGITMAVFEGLSPGEAAAADANAS
jgi:hypothetical protein